MDNVSKKIDDLKSKKNESYLEFCFDLVESKKLLISYLSTYFRFIKDYEATLDDYFRNGDIDYEEYCELFDLIVEAYSNYKYLSDFLSSSSIDWVNSCFKKVISYIKKLILEFEEL